ncbi:MAG: MotA/TolQ/ExbB proton channel family protein [Planctomycetaceae bacterium]
MGGHLLDAAGYGIYAALAVTALYGIYGVLVLARRIAQKRFGSNAAAEQFLDDVRDRLSRRDFDGVAAVCDTPGYWSKAVPQLILVALQNRNLPPAKTRRVVAENFEREILADLEYRTSWIATLVKSAPMLGLLGTVVGMILAFEKIAGATAQGVDAKALGGDISFALVTTAIGLIIAIPLVLAGAALHVRIGKLQDSVQQHLGRFFDDFDAAQQGDRPA